MIKVHITLVNYMKKSHVSYAVLLGLIISLFSAFFIKFEFFIYIGIIGVIWFIILYFLSKKQVFTLWIIFFIFFCIWTYRSSFVFKQKPVNHVVYKLWETHHFKWKIVEEVDIRKNNTKYTVEISSIDDKNSEWRILINSKQNFQYGDVISFTGIIKLPPQFKDFNYAEYLSRYEIYGISYNSEIIKLSHNPDNILLKFIFNQKRNFLNRIQKIYPEPYASYLAGLLIWARKWMPSEITNNFQVTGLSHIVAVSGSNITMILAIIATLFMFIPRMISIIISVIFIILFTIFVGMSAAVVRAAVMWVIALIAINTGRPNTPSISMLLTIAVMGLWQPKMYVYDVWFQLSVAAVIGVIWVVPLMPKFFQKLPQSFGLKEAIALTIAAQITTLPISVMHFWSFSIIAPLANLFVIPIIPFAMLFGFISLIPLGIFSYISSFITYLSLKFTLFISLKFAQIPYAQIKEISIPNWIWIFYLLFIIGFVFYKFHTTKEN